MVRGGSIITAPLCAAMDGLVDGFKELYFFQKLYQRRVNAAFQRPAQIIT
jgi:hypothetical protein